MRKSGVGSGGGVGNNKVTRVAPKAGKPAREVRPKGVAQIGTSRGNHAMRSGKVLHGDVEPVRGQRLPAAVRHGNDPALTGTVGVGAGRTIHVSGGQGQHGPVAGTAKPQGREILGPKGGRQP